MTATERHAGATPIRPAAASDTQVRLLALPVEPPVGSEVEVRSADGYREGGWVSVDDERSAPDVRRTRRWAPAHHATATAIQRETWGGLCEYAIRYRCELWLTREGPLVPDTKEDP